MLCSQGVVVATAMAVSGTVLLIALRLQKSIPASAAQFSVHHLPLMAHQSRSLRSCISSGKKSEKISTAKNKKKRSKKVRFAEDVAEPRGNGDEFRKHCNAIAAAKSNAFSSNSAAADSSPEGMPENRRALYSGMLRDRGVQRLTYSYR